MFFVNKFVDLLSSQQKEKAIADTGVKKKIWLKKKTYLKVERNFQQLKAGTINTSAVHIKKPELKNAFKGLFDSVLEKDT